VRRLVNHLIGMNRVFAALLADEPVPRPAADHVDDDPAGAYRDSAARLQAAFDAPGVLERTYSGPLGAATGAERLQIRLYDLLAHGWDLAQATGQPAALPDNLCRGAGWPAWAWVMLAAAVPAFAAFLAAQRRTAASGGHPLVSIGVLARPAILAGLVALLLANGTYFALLFTLAQYFQAGLHRSALATGLILVPWVAAFGAAGQLTRRLPARAQPVLPAAGYLLMAAAYAAIAVTVRTGPPGYPLLALLLAAGGLGLGTGFATLIGHLTGAVPAGYAPDISGVTTTTLQVGGAIAVAAFGTIYLSLAHPVGAAPGGHAFAVTSLALAATALTAAAAAYLATHARGNGTAAEPTNSSNATRTAVASRRSLPGHGGLADVDDGCRTGTSIRVT
jgi:uncharacterized protein (TIGR03086 family)